MGKTQSSSASIPYDADEVFRMKGNSSPSKWGQSYNSQTITRVYVISSRLLHGSYSWLATGLANVVSAGTSAPIEHWWVILQSSQAYYCINIWVNDIINIYRTKRWRAAIQVGLSCAGKDQDSETWREKQCACSRKFQEFTRFINGLSAYYSMASNNCQDISKKIYNFA